MTERGAPMDDFELRARLVALYAKQDAHDRCISDLTARVALLERAQNVDLLREPARGMTVRRLQELLAGFPDAALVAATYDDGSAGGSIMRVRAGRDPDTDAPAVLVEIG